jgi:hypothetical protein
MFALNGLNCLQSSYCSSYGLIRYSSVVFLSGLIVVSSHGQSLRCMIISYERWVDTHEQDGHAPTT